GAHAHLGDFEAPGGQQGPVLLERSPHVTWSEALVHLRQLKEGATSTLAWPDVDDLSALAAAIADLTGASITIEDPASRVLAHANLGDELDEIRRETILTGAIPAWRIAELEESGTLDTVRPSTDVVDRRAAGAAPGRFRPGASRTSRIPASSTRADTPPTSSNAAPPAPRRPVPSSPCSARAS